MKPANSSCTGSLKNTLVSSLNIGISGGCSKLVGHPVTVWR